MDEITDIIEHAFSNIKGLIYVAGFVIGAIPILDIGTKIQWSAILTIILLFISPDEATEYFRDRATRVISSYVFSVILGVIVQNLLFSR